MAIVSNGLVPTQRMPAVLRVIADWNPVSAVTAAARNLWGNPNPSATIQAWPMQHPVAASLLWSVALLVIFAPLATFLYRRRTTADTDVVSAEQLSRDEVVAFLGGQPSTPEDLEALSGGAWSSAWAYRAGGEELVVRFGPEVSWYEADRMAMAFAGPDLPVPEVREVGATPSGRAYAISVRHHGRFLEDTPVEQVGAIAPTLTRLLVAFYRVPAGPDTPVVWHHGASPAASWRKFLLDGLVDDPGKLVHGWSAVLAGDQELAALSAAVTERVRTLVEACPERRDLVHGDLLHGNVLVSPDARRVEAVLSWKCSVRGDFLFDAAWCSFWAPFHPGIAAADPLSALLRAPSVRAEPGALHDAATRHHCYELHIGFTHLGWNIWTGNQADLAATARRLAEVLERGPLPLASARSSAET